MQLSMTVIECDSGYGSEPPNSALNPTSLRSAGYCHVRHTGKILKIARNSSL
jgi:hypothetical protein